MFCIYCGADVPEGTEACPECGKQVLMDGVHTELPKAPDPEDESDTTVFPAVQVVGDGRDIYSSAPHRFRPDPDEAEDIFSSGGIPVDAPLKKTAEKEAPVRPEPAFEVYTGPRGPVYRDGYVYEEIEEGMPEKRRRPWLWLLILIPVALAVLGSAIWAYFWYNSPMQELDRALAADDYSRIAQLLPQLEEDELHSIANDMQTYAAGLVDQYNEGQIEFGSAYGLIERVQRLFPDNQTLRIAVTTMQKLKTSKEEYLDALSADHTGNVDDALRLYAAVIPEDRNYSAAQARIAEITADYKASVLAQAQQLAESEDFRGAQEVLDKSAAVLGDDPDIAAKREELLAMEQESYVTGMLAIAQQMATDGDWIGAIRVLEEATREDERFGEQIKLYTQYYKNEKLAEAEDLADRSSFEEAVALLENAQSFLKDDEEVAAKIKEYKEKYPILLVDMRYMGGENCNTGWSAQTANGTSYSKGLGFALYPLVAETVYTEYKPAGKYKYFSGTWVVDKDTTEAFIGKIRVYVDGSLQYELSSLTVNSGAVDMNLKIEGAKVIRIEAEGAFADAHETGYLYLAGATFRN